VRLNEFKDRLRVRRDKVVTRLIRARKPFLRPDPRFAHIVARRFSRSVQVDHRHCRPAANETMLGLRRAVGAEVVHWLGANKPAYKLDPGFLDRGTAGSLWHGLSK
jgi:hypothetical protein